MQLIFLLEKGLMWTLSSIISEAEMHNSIYKEIIDDKYFTIWSLDKDTKGTIVNQTINGE